MFIEAHTIAEFQTPPPDLKAALNTNLSHNIFGVLCNVFMLMWITEDQFYKNLTNHKKFEGEKKQIM